MGDEENTSRDAFFCGQSSLARRNIFECSTIEKSFPSNMSSPGYGRRTGVRLRGRAPLQRPPPRRAGPRADGGRRRESLPARGVAQLGVDLSEGGGVPRGPLLPHLELVQPPPPLQLHLQGQGEELERQLPLGADAERAAAEPAHALRDEAGHAADELRPQAPLVVRAGFAGAADDLVSVQALAGHDLHPFHSSRPSESAGT